MKSGQNRTEFHAAQVTAHYDAGYATSQLASDDIKCRVEVSKFAEFVEPDHDILDFGCGGGRILSSLPGRRKVGIEVGEIPAKQAAALGIEVHGTLDAVEPSTVDVVISNHALEHVPHPLEDLVKMHGKLREGGRLVICVPCDAPSFPFSETDRDLHLYSWSANNLANLCKVAGFRIEQAAEWPHRLPPAWQKLHPLLGDRLFDFACRVWGRCYRKRRQVRVVAVKPADQPR